MADPSLPEGILLEFAVPSTAQRWRVAEDGRWLVTAPDGTEQERAPISREDMGANRLSPRALDRIRAALAQVGFASLPDSVRGSSGLAVGIRVADGDPLGRIRYLITARVGTVKRVSVEADARYAPSFGVLEPLFRVLDDEALGIWQMR